MNEPVTGGTKKVALVTGAGRGIGRAIALALAARGWSVVINYLSNTAAARQTLEGVLAASGSGLLVQADVALAAGRQKLVEETLAAFGKIDLLVNNAGRAPRQRVDILETSEASYDEVMAANLRGPFFLTQKVAAIMLQQVKAGSDSLPRIINIGSVSAYASSLNRTEYCLSKAGVAMMTVLFADRLAEAGINVYEIRPGIVHTDMTLGTQARYDSLIAGGLTPLRRWGEPEDVARAVVAVAENWLPFSTGEVINVDGGFHLRRL